MLLVVILSYCAGFWVCLFLLVRLFWCAVLLLVWAVAFREWFCSVGGRFGIDFCLVGYFSGWLRLVVGVMVGCLLVALGCCAWVSLTLPLWVVSCVWVLCIWLVVY